MVANFSLPGILTIRYNEYKDIQKRITLVLPLRIALRSNKGINLGRP